LRFTNSGEFAGLKVSPSSKSARSSLVAGLIEEGGNRQRGPLRKLPDQANGCLQTALFRDRACLGLQGHLVFGQCLKAQLTSSRCVRNFQKSGPVSIQGSRVPRPRSSDPLATTTGGKTPQQLPGARRLFGWLPVTGLPLSCAGQVPTMKQRMAKTIPAAEETLRSKTDIFEIHREGPTEHFRLKPSRSDEFQFCIISARFVTHFLKTELERSKSPQLAPAIPGESHTYLESFPAKSTVPRRQNRRPVRLFLDLSRKWIEHFEFSIGFTVPQLRRPRADLWWRRGQKVNATLFGFAKRKNCNSRSFGSTSPGIRMPSRRKSESPEPSDRSEFSVRLHRWRLGLQD